MKKSILLVMVMTAVVVQTTFAAAHSTSHNVAVIPSFYSYGSGTLNPANFPGFIMTQVSPGSISSVGQLAQYDTVILFEHCNVNSYPNLNSALIQWLQLYGGKLIIWDSDACYQGNFAYGWLSPVGAYFERFSPGQTGNYGGSVSIVEENSLGSLNPASPYYINTVAMVNQTDAVGDLNVVNENTVAPVWCALMRGVNTYGRSGYAHMYTKVGGLTGAPDAIILYSGFDWDWPGVYGSGSAGSAALIKLMTLELAHGWGPPGSPEVADLNCQVPVGNLVLTPATAVNAVPGQHTVTATVTIYNFGTGQTVPVPGVTVDFVITAGPNAGLTGSAVSDAQGIVTFTYTTSGQGVDVISAQATVNNVVKTATAQKTWCNPPAITRALAGNRGYYTLTASSDCYAPADLNVFVKDSASAFVAGPFASGTTVRVMRGSPGTGAGTGTASVTIFVSGYGQGYAVDPLNSTSATVNCPP